MATPSTSRTRTQIGATSPAQHILGLLCSTRSPRTTIRPDPVNFSPLVFLCGFVLVPNTFDVFLQIRCSLWTTQKRPQPDCHSEIRSVSHRNFHEVSKLLEHMCCCNWQRGAAFHFWLPLVVCCYFVAALFATNIDTRQCRFIGQTTTPLPQTFPIADSTIITATTSTTTAICITW